MKSILISAAAMLALAGAAVFAFGDIARPKTAGSPEARTVLYSGLTIVTDSKAYDAKLQISEATLKRISEGAAREGSSASLIQNISHSSTRTMMAGVFMFLAVSFAGVWFARSNQRRNAKAMVTVLIVAFIFGIGTVMVHANAGPPGYIRWQNLPQSLKDGKPTYGGVDIEIVPGDDNIKLIVPLRKSGGSSE
jgi:hypothetical protein